MRDSCRNRGVDLDTGDVLKKRSDGCMCDCASLDMTVWNLSSGVAP